MTTQLEAPVTKACPRCGETILAIAVKCKHCGSDLDGRDAGPTMVTPVPQTETLGWGMVGIPVLATLLVWFWVGNMNLFQNPGSSLSLIMIAVLVSTAVIAAVEANKLGMGSDTDLKQNGKKREGPVAWAAVVLLLWIVGYPAYLYRRRLYGRRNLLVAGVLSALVYTGSHVVMAKAIDDKVAEIQRAGQELQRAGEELQRQAEEAMRNLR